METPYCQLTYLLVLSLTVEFVLAGTIIAADTKPAQCVVTINNLQVIKDVRSVWKTNDSCVQHSCDLDDYGNPHENLHEETCVLNCKDEYEYRPDPSQCCGTCVKTKCLFNGKLYAVGDTWHNKDGCTILECVLHNGEAMISTYEKTCPPVAPNCPKSDLYEKDCCTHCRRDTGSIPSITRMNTGGADIFPDADGIMDRDYYRQHPCIRDCTLEGEPMICKYTFVVEWYETLSKACYDCPHNVTDCNRPHCITGDGIRRSVTVVNRMMPGPAIEVCLNDIIVVDVKNHMLGESTTIHWHGLHQKENPYMDGVPHISQCPILPHATFRYKFKATNVGTHFWHSHTGMQRGDGCFGALTIRQPKKADVHGESYDFDLSEHTLIVQDWAHQPGVAMFASHHHSIGDNKPPNILVNGHGRYFPDIFKRINENKQVQTSTSASPLELIEDDANRFAESTTVDTLTEDETTLIPSIELDSVTSQPDVFLYQSESERNMKIKAPSNRLKRTTATNGPLENIPLEHFNVVSGFRYRFRIINAEFLNCPIAISVDNHTLSVINSDGFDVEMVNVTAVVTYAGERFDFILHANQPSGNYWIRMKGLMDCDARFTSAFQVAVLHYESAENEEPVGVPQYDFSPGGVELNSLNVGPGFSDLLTIDQLKSLERGENDDKQILKENADFKFFVYYDFYPKDNPDFHPSNIYGFNQIKTNSNKVLTPQLNHITLKMPSLPLMPARDQLNDSMFCNETTLENEGKNCREEFCKCHHVLQVPLNSIVELILVDEGLAYDANHPFHLHGNAFRVIGLDRVGPNVTIETIKEMDRLGQLHRNFDRPPVKDTVTVPDGGYTIVRFKAYNPGYWLLHCHIEFHAEIGMALVIKVGEHHEMVPVPKNFPQCSDYVPALHEYPEAPRGNAEIPRVTWIFLLIIVLGLNV